MNQQQSLATKPVRPEALIECSNCHAKNTFRKSIVERPADFMEAGVIQILSICPDCGHEQHSYFMSPKLKLARDVSASTIKALSQRRTQKNFDMVRDIREKYKNLFDEEQSKYQAILGVKNILEKDDGRTA